MKKVFLTLSMVLAVFTISTAQPLNFDVVTNIEESKTEIYTKALEAISTVYNDSNNIIRMADKESGVIIIKAKLPINVPSVMGIVHTHYFDYNLKMMFKNGKYRILLDNVHYSGITTYTSAAGKGVNDFSLPDNLTVWSTGFRKAGISKKKHPIFLATLSNKLQNTINLIVTAINEGSTDDDW